MKARGDYVEYARGEHYQAVPGVLSAGEETENGGVQLFYLYPEEFGDIYAKRKRRETETAVRKVVSLLQPKKNATASKVGWIWVIRGQPGCVGP